MNTNPWCCDHAVHLCIVVRDMEKTLDNYCALFHLERPPVKWTGTPKDAHVEYRDEPSPAMAKQAFLQFGMLRLELIEPDRNPSTWREYLDRNGDCVHHVAFEVDDMQESLACLAQSGIQLIQKGDYNGGRYAYVDSEQKLAVMMELLQNDR